MISNHLANKTGKARNNRKQRPDSAKICNATKENKASETQFFSAASTTEIRLKSPMAAKKISNQRVSSPPVKRSQAFSMTPEQVEIESLRAQVKALEAQVVVT